MVKPALQQELRTEHSETARVADFLRFPISVRFNPQVAQTPRRDPAELWALCARLPTVTAASPGTARSSRLIKAEPRAPRHLLAQYWKHNHNTLQSTLATSHKNKNKIKNKPRPSALTQQRVTEDGGLVFCILAHTIPQSHHLACSASWARFRCWKVFPVSRGTDPGPGIYLKGSNFVQNLL